MAVNDIYRTTLVGTLHGQDVLAGMHYRESLTAGTDGSFKLAIGLQARYVANLKPLLSDQFNLRGTLVQKIFPGDTAAPTFAITGAGNGGQAIVSVPTSVAMVVTKRTAKAGRKYRGRMYIGGIGIDDVLESQMIDASLTLFQTAFDAIRPAIGGTDGTFLPVLWHRSTNTWDDITDLVCRPVMRNQRRRQFGKGS